MPTLAPAIEKGKNLSKQQRLASQKIASASTASTQQPNPSFLLSPFGHQVMSQPVGPNPSSALPVVST
jgi:hypothetical protein